MKKVFILFIGITLLSCNQTSIENSNAKAIGSASIKYNKIHNMETRKIIGVSVLTTNENGQSYEDTGKLWDRFFKISNQILNKKSDDIYAIYTDYETDYTGQYTAIIGYEVNSIQTIPEGLVGKEIGGGKYEKIIAKGEMPNAIMQTWQEVWKRDKELNRRYTSDFEIHGINSQKGKDSEVEIFISIN